MQFSAAFWALEQELDIEAFALIYYCYFHSLLFLSVTANLDQIIKVTLEVWVVCWKRTHFPDILFLPLLGTSISSTETSFI